MLTEHKTELGILFDKLLQNQEEYEGLLDIVESENGQYCEYFGLIGIPDISHSILKARTLQVVEIMKQVFEKETGLNKIHLEYVLRGMESNKEIQKTVEVYLGKTDVLRQLSEFVVEDATEMFVVQLDQKIRKDVFENVYSDEGEHLFSIEKEDLLLEFSHFIGKRVDLTILMDSDEWSIAEYLSEALYDEMKEHLVEMKDTFDGWSLNLYGDSLIYPELEVSIGALPKYLKANLGSFIMNEAEAKAINLSIDDLPTPDELNKLIIDVQNIVKVRSEHFAIDSDELSEVLVGLKMINQAIELNLPHEQQLKLVKKIQEQEELSDEALIMKSSLKKEQTSAFPNYEEFLEAQKKVFLYTCEYELKELSKLVSSEKRNETLEKIFNIAKEADLKLEGSHDVMYKIIKSTLDNDYYEFEVKDEDERGIIAHAVQEIQQLVGYQIQFNKEEFVDISRDDILRADLLADYGLQITEQTLHDITFSKEFLNEKGTVVLLEETVEIDNENTLSLTEVVLSQVDLADVVECLWWEARAQYGIIHSKEGAHECITNLEEEQTEFYNVLEKIKKETERKHMELRGE